MPKPAKHKRKGPKQTRSGCLLCKPHKLPGYGQPRHSDCKRAGIEEYRGLGQQY